MLAPEAAKSLAPAGPVHAISDSTDPPAPVAHEEEPALRLTLPCPGKKLSRMVANSGFIAASGSLAFHPPTGAGRVAEAAGGACRRAADRIRGRPAQACRGRWWRRRSWRRGR